MADEGPRSRGVVSKFIVSKGYGFIKHLDDDGGAGDLFFHQSEIKSKGLRLLKKGQFVEFFIVRKGVKIKAVSVTVVDDDRDDSGETRCTSGGGGGKCSDCRKIGCMVRDCDKCGGGSGVSGGVRDSRHSGREGDKAGGGVFAVEVAVSEVVGGDSRHMGRDGDKADGGFLAVEAVAKVVEKSGSSVSGGGGGDSRHFGRDGDKAGGGILCVVAPVAKFVGKTGSRVGGGGDSRHLGKVPVVGKTGNRVSGGDSRPLSKGSKNVGDTLAVKETAAVAKGVPKGVPNISLHVGGGMRVRGGGDPKHLDKDCDKAGGGTAMDIRVGKVVGNTSSNVSGIDMAGRVLEVETGFAKFGIHNNISDQQGHMANDCKDFCYICDKPGHTSSDCKGFCYNCDRYGHMASDCPGFCYNCDRHGHMASDCPGFCYNCDRYGHMASDCPGFCYNCDQHGHMASDCPGFCYNCLKPGHMASDCPGFCYNCLKPGHMASGCPGFPI